jgi:hypothetical protein
MTGWRSLVAVAAFCVLALATYRLSFSPFNTVVMLAWTVLAVGTLGSMQGADRPYRRAWWAAFLAFPVWEFGLKYLITRDVIAYSWFWLNRLEHLGWMTSSLLLLLPACRRVWGLPWPVAVLFVLGLGGLIGNLNEFFEYGLRLIWNTAGKAVWYSDTILDMLTNVAGALLACLAGWRLDRASTRSGPVSGAGQPD